MSELIQTSAVKTELKAEIVPSTDTKMTDPTKSDEHPAQEPQIVQSPRGFTLPPFEQTIYSDYHKRMRLGLDSEKLVLSPHGNIANQIAQSPEEQQSPTDLNLKSLDDIPVLPCKRNFQSTIQVKDSIVENPEHEDTHEKGAIKDKDVRDLLELPLIPNLQPVTYRVDESAIMHSEEPHDSELVFKQEPQPVDPAQEHSNGFDTDSDHSAPEEAQASDQEVELEGESSEYMICRMKSTRAYLPKNLKDYKKYVLRMTDPRDRGEKSATFNIENARLVRALFFDGTGHMPNVIEIKGQKEIESLITGRKTYQCPKCFMRNSQFRGEKDHKLKCGNRSWMLYKHLRINEDFLCLVCFAGFPIMRSLVIHYLRHSWYDCKTLGLHPFNLAKAFSKPQAADDERPTSQQAGNVKTRQTLEQKMALKFGSMIVKGRFQGNLIDINKCNYNRTQESDDEDSWNYNEWDKKSPHVMSTHDLQFMHAQNIQHRLMKPFISQHKTLLRHLLYYSGHDLWYGEFNNHAVFFYPRRTLDILAGGVAQLMRSLTIVDQLAVVEPEIFGNYKLITYINSDRGIEVVMKAKVDFNTSELWTMKHATGNKPKACQLKKYWTYQCDTASRMVEVLIKHNYACTDLTRPCNWVHLRSLHSDTGHMMYAAVHTFIPLHDYHLMHRVSFGSVRVNFDLESARKAMQTQATILFFQALRDLHCYPILGLTDTTVTAHMHYNKKDFEESFTSPARKHNFHRLQTLYQLLDDDTNVALTEKQFYELTVTLEALVKKQLYHLEVSVIARHGIFKLALKENLPEASHDYPPFSNVLQLTKDHDDKREILFMGTGRVHHHIDLKRLRAYQRVNHLAEFEDEKKSHLKAMEEQEEDERLYEQAQPKK